MRLRFGMLPVLFLGCKMALASAWVPYINERFGFSFSYPAAMFASERRSQTGDGEVFATDAGAKLLVGAFENTDGHTVSSYMDFIRRQSYGAFSIDYSPHGTTWFVLSGENQREVFYEKVMFSCGGRIINSFSLIYPVDAKRAFDPIVAGIEKTFRPGHECARDATR